MKCIFCAYESVENFDWNFCPECGANISDKCHKCGADVIKGAKFCVRCGASMRYRQIISELNGNILLVMEAGKKVTDTISSETAIYKNENAENLFITDQQNTQSTSLDLNSFNQSETPEFLKNINARSAAKNRLENERRSEDKKTQSGLLDLRSFNDSETPDFLNEIIKKGKAPMLNLETNGEKKIGTPPEEKLESHNQPSGDNSDDNETIKQNVNVFEETVPDAIAGNFSDETGEKEIIDNVPAVSNEETSITSADETPHKTTAGLKLETSGEKTAINSFDKFKTPPRIESILKKDGEKFPSDWGIPVVKKEKSQIENDKAETDNISGKMSETADTIFIAADTASEVMNTTAETTSITLPEAPASSVTGFENRRETAATLPHFRLIAVDSGNNRIQFITTGAKFLNSFGTRGSGTAQFDNPQKAAVDSAGNIYISDFSNNRIQKFTSDGKHTLSFGSHGGKNGEFNYPCGLTVSKEGLLFVVDSYNNRIQIFDCDGKYISKFEGAEINSDVQLDTPTDIALDSSNNIYVCDTGNNRVIKFDPKWHKLYELGITDKKNQGFDSPGAICIDKDDNLIVADTGNHLIKIFDNMGRIISCFGSKGQKEGKLDSPGALDCDREKNIYIADTWNNRIQIFTFNGAFIKAIGSYGSDPGKFNHINDVVIIDEITQTDGGE